MPQFKLKPEERESLAAYLIASEEKAGAETVPVDAAVLEKGKKLLQTTGCLNCHALKLENQFTASALAQLAPEKWNHGCLAEKPAENSKAAVFGFSAEERSALQAFGATDRSSLSRNVWTEFAERQMRNSNCRQCHGPIEGVPPLDNMGGKLKPEWMAAFISGKIDYKPRPWLESQMPAFPKRAEGLAKGMAMSHGFPPQSPVEPAVSVDAEAVKIGTHLVSQNGFSCVSCHSVGSFEATQVFEAPGNNLAYSGDRLQPSFFRRWLRNPTLVDPMTKMPVYFDEEGRSPLTDYYEGSGEKQIDAILQYIRLGDKMPPPVKP